MSESKSQDPIRCKTILVGESGVGKTSIIGRYIKKFNPNEKSTIGASFTNKKDIINGKTILFEIWDTAGQERFRSINSIFYQDAYICILVYDITNKKSFESLKNYWYNSVKENATEGLLFHIAGNKIDLFDNEEVDRNEIKEFCNTIDAEYNFISALEDSYIDDLFKKVGERFLKSDIYKKLEDNKQQKKPDKFALDKDINKTDNDNENDNDNKNEKKKNKKKKCC